MFFKPCHNLIKVIKRENSELFSELKYHFLSILLAIYIERLELGEGTKPNKYLR